MKLLRRSDVLAHMKSIIEVKSKGSSLEANSPAWHDTILSAVIAETDYAILSHRWLNEGELTFQDVSKLGELSTAGLKAAFHELTQSGNGPVDLASIIRVAQAHATLGLENNPGEATTKLGILEAFCAHLGTDGAGLIKLVRFCVIASQKYKYAWMDTCCIDKARSAELEESIRSMFRWYSSSKTCIAHLADTLIDQWYPHLSSDPWFTRGWTLQELLAPRSVEFFDQDWRPITDTAQCLNYSFGAPPVSLWQGISDATGINLSILRSFKPGMKHVRQIMVWAAKRQTTRIEDVAYSLIGMLDVPLSIAYGEGSMAFYRLQLEIVQRTHDKGIFVWQGERSKYSSIFAASPKCFSPAHFRSLPFVPQNDVDRTHSFTNYGMRMPLSLYDVVVKSPESLKDDNKCKEYSKDHGDKVNEDNSAHGGEAIEVNSGVGGGSNSDEETEVNSGEESEVDSDEESEVDVKESHREGPISYVLEVPALRRTISVVSVDALAQYDRLVIAILGSGIPSGKQSKQSLALLLGYRRRQDQYTRVVTQQMIWVKRCKAWSPPKIIYIK